MPITSYAQNFEDVILWRALKHVERGFYIDIGAQDPVVDSVSLAFYERGWRGVHVEPAALYATKLRSARPDEEVIEAAVGTGTGLLAFHEFPGTGLSTGVPAIARQHAQAGFEIKEHPVPIISLQNVLDRCAEREVHWLKIDVEGMESAAIESWGSSIVRPWIVLVESTLPLSTKKSHQEWQPQLKKLGYEFVYFDGLNRFYVSKERPELKGAFGPGPNIFDQFAFPASSESGMVAPARQRFEAAEKKKAEIQKQSDDLSAAIGQAEAEGKRLTVHVAVLSEQLAQEQEKAKHESKRLAAQIVTLSEQLTQERHSLAFAVSRAARYDRLVLELRDEGSPRALKLVLPLARLFRQVHHAVGRDNSIPITPSEKSMISPANFPPPAGPAPSRLRSTVKRGALGVYRILLRPIVRPLMWRFRTFLLKPVFERLDHPHPGTVEAFQPEQTQLLKSLEVLALTIASNPPREH